MKYVKAIFTWFIFMTIKDTMVNLATVFFAFRALPLCIKMENSQIFEQMELLQRSFLHLTYFYVNKRYTMVNLATILAWNQIFLQTFSR